MAALLEDGSYFGKNAVGSFLIVLETDKAVHEVAGELLPDPRVFQKQRFYFLQFFLVKVLSLPAAVFVDNKLTDGILISVMQCQIVGSQLAPLDDAEVDSSQVHQQFEDLVPPVDNSDH